MRVFHPAVRRAALGAGVGLLTATAVAGPAAAMPDPVPAPVSAPPAGPGADAVALAARVDRVLGSRTAGSYLEQGRLVVTVTDDAAAAQVSAAGATPRRVARDGAALAEARRRAEAAVTVPGTTIGVDPAANQVVVRHDESVTGDRLAGVRAAVAALGDAARLESTPGRFALRLTGGDFVRTDVPGGYVRCSLGFNVRKGATSYFVTAGHCTKAGKVWKTRAGKRVGVRAGTSFPGNDYGLVKYDAAFTAHPGKVGGQRITRAADPVVGQRVTRRGITTGVRRGTVLQVGVTATLQDGTRIGGLILTDACAAPGDSGGPLFQGTTAYGLLSAGAGDCVTGGQTLFQPITEVLRRYRVTLA